MLFVERREVLNINKVKGGSRAAATNCREFRIENIQRKHHKPMDMKVALEKCTIHISL